YYRAARDSSMFDAWRNRAGGVDRPGESFEGAERRRAKALQQVAAHAADIEFRQRHALAQNNPQEQAAINRAYYDLMNHIGHDDVEELRRRFNVADVVEGDLEGNLKPLSDDVKEQLGVIVHGSRTVDPSILKVEERLQKQPEPEQHSGDWSPDQMARYAEKANAQEAKTRAEHQQFHSRPPSEIDKP